MERETETKPSSKLKIAWNLLAFGLLIGAWMQAGIELVDWLIPDAPINIHLDQGASAEGGVSWREA